MSANELIDVAGPSYLVVLALFMAWIYSPMRQRRRLRQWQAKRAAKADDDA